MKMTLKATITTVITLVVIAVLPPIARAHSLLGTAYRLNQQHKEPVEAYSTALEVASKDEHWNEGWDKNTRDFLKQSQNALDPNYQKTAEEYFEEGRAYFNAGKYAEAIEPFKEATRLKPDYAFAYGFLGKCYAEVNRTDEAIQALKQAIRINPNVHSFHGVLGETYLSVKRNREAAEEFKEAQRLKPSDSWSEGLEKAVDALLVEVISYLDAGKYAEAIELANQTTLLKPDYDQTFWLLGVAYVKSEKYAEAVAPLKEAARLNPKKSTNSGALGDAYLALGRNQEAFDAYTQALKVAPSDQRWLNGLKAATKALDAPPHDVVKKQAESVWRADHTAEIAKAGDARFQYQGITLKPTEERPPGAAPTDLLYSANVKFSATLGNGQPASSMTYNIELNQCFYKKRDMPLWSTLPCVRQYLVKVDPKVLDAYVGQYQMPRVSELQPEFVLNLFREGDKLISEAFGRRMEFRPLSETEFYLKEEDRTVKFVKNEQGQVTHIKWQYLTVKKIK